jgi:hypothetical protein
MTVPAQTKLCSHDSCQLGVKTEYEMMIEGPIKYYKCNIAHGEAMQECIVPIFAMAIITDDKFYVVFRPQHDTDAICESVANILPCGNGTDKKVFVDYMKFIRRNLNSWYDNLLVCC